MWAAVPGMPMTVNSVSEARAPPAEADAADSTVEATGGVMFPGDLVQSSQRPFGPAEVALPQFSLTVRALDSGFREVRVEGELDLAVADQLKRAIDGAVGGPVLVDLSECSFIDSTGIAVVLLARRDGERV